MEGTQTKVTREKRKSPFLSLSIYLLLPSLFLPASISVPSWRLPVFQLLLFPNKDGCLPLCHRGNTFRATCLCYSFKTMRLLFSFISILSVVFFSSAAIRSDTPSISHQFHPKKSNTKAHILPHTYATHTGLLLPFCYKLLCVRGQDVLMLPVYLWAK